MDACPNETHSQMDFMKFLFSRTMLKNLVFIVLTGLLLFFGILMILKAYTNHGDEFELTDFTGLYPDELGSHPQGDRLQFEIIDTIFSDIYDRGSIASQSPSPGSRVKKGRRVFLTVVSDEPEKVNMPNVMNTTLRLATAKLESYGLLVGSKEFVPSEYKDAVLDQKYRGSHIDPGTSILKGSFIDLEIGQGLGNERTAVPVLLGLKKSDVMRIMSETALNLGTEVFDDSEDTSQVRVYRQSPSPTRALVLRRGSSIDLWYRKGTIEEFETLRRKYLRDTVMTEESYDDLLP